ncbi:patatin-like phospholipase family protein [Burkholderia ubonensis]|uniref:patatin-like phospholipase family protein n=1 Tax=Burkholderia ubonensis TaxID=101571 RepID=UPI000ACAF495|nr:patatin-like phospholipase family protein [Burkholderia ubonensis]
MTGIAFAVRERGHDTVRALIKLFHYTKINNCIGFQAPTPLVIDRGKDVTTWKQRLQVYNTSGTALFNDGFLERWGQNDWSPVEADRRAAAELHTQIATRVATQPLRYGDGVESSALDSLYRLFDITREIQDRHFGATHFEMLAWQVLNAHIRPFTSKWHRRSVSGALSALDDTDAFRSDLEELRPLVLLFDELLLDIRDGQRPLPAPADDNANERLENEMAESLEWGISPTGSETQKACAKEINAAERKAIEERRNTYSIDPERDYATGLALSGGGIRSATFSLGVLIALARRNLLPDFDYLSTVSGGGYLGSFLTTFLSTTSDETDNRSSNLGLRSSQRPFLKEEGEAQAIRHLRHHSKYLHTSLVERVVMAASQIYGMLVNGLALALLPSLFALVEYLVRTTADSRLPDLHLDLAAIAAMGAITIAVPLLVRFVPWVRTHADPVLAWLVAPLLLLASWQALGWLHRYMDFFGTSRLGIPMHTLMLIAAGAIPLVCACAIALLGRRNARMQIPLAAIAGCVAPVFVVELELLIYQWLCGAGPNLTNWAWLPLGRVSLLGLALLITYFVVCMPLDINFTSPHRHYRRKLAEAFLIQPTREENPERPFDTGIRIKLSEMNPCARAPYHLLNGALNVPASNSPAMQGRLTDFFVFSRDYCGSPLTGYAKTKVWEGLDSGLDLGTAMAASGAATSPLMGPQTKHYQTFWLAMLNVRLGYWLKNPFHRFPNACGTPGIIYLLSEMFGRIHEKGRYLNVTDGGHIENLGIYELLRRRCKYIVAIDGEHDPAMTFHALTTLQRLASIDLGISIEIDLDDLRLREDGLSRSHFQMCRIRYPETATKSQGTGYLIYAKLSLTGNEGEFIRRYRMDEPAFPHHPTANQFFTEAQFEAYRSLGEHVGDKLFMKAIVGEVASGQSLSIQEWFRLAGRSILA